MLRVVAVALAFASLSEVAKAQDCSPDGQDRVPVNCVQKAYETGFKSACDQLAGEMVMEAGGISCKIIGIGPTTQLPGPLVAAPSQGIGFGQGMETLEMLEQEVQQ